MKYSLKLITLLLSTFAVCSFLRAGPPAADVGDAESFGHAALYMGAASGFVHLKPATAACTPAPAPLPPATANDDQCFTLNSAPDETSFEAKDICRIKLPKKATRTIIYPALNFFIDYQLRNTSGTDQPSAVFDFSAELVIESDALL